eukprot:scaffold12330_cov83-Skeletonema_marinoi.AAC.24
MSTSDNNNPTSIGGDQSLLLSVSASTGSRFTMHSSAAQSGNVAHLTKKLSADEFAIIFGFLSHVDIMRARVCTTWREAAKKTLVPPTDTDFRVNSVRSFNAMRVMATALPNLQQLLIVDIGHGHKYSDGEDPDEEWARRTANDTTYDINIISSFRKLRSLKISSLYSNLNGRYPVFFNFSLLQRLSITNCCYLKWDLEMLASFPLLRELQVGNSNALTGDLSSLRALRDTLEMVKIVGGGVLSLDIHIRGNFMDLADFPRLKELDLNCTTVTGHIGDIRGHDFPALERLRLPKSVRGGMNYKFQNISDVPDFIHTIYLLLQRTPTLFDQHLLSYAFFWTLSEDSPDWYDRDDGSETPFPPFVLRFIQAGSRLGWSWYSHDDEDYDYEDECHSCEINWLDPERSSESDDYEACIEALQRVERREDMDFYRGYHEPPTEQQYRRLCEGVGQRD